MSPHTLTAKNEVKMRKCEVKGTRGEVSHLGTEVPDVRPGSKRQVKGRAKNDDNSNTTTHIHHS